MSICDKIEDEVAYCVQHKTFRRKSSMVKKALVVDDDPHLVRMCKSMIQMIKGVEVTTASDFKTGMSLLKTGHFDLVLSDYNMPCGSEGAEICQTARMKNPDCAIILMSGDLITDRKNIEALCGADHYLEKPFRDIGPIIKLIEECLHLEKVPVTR